MEDEDVRTSCFAQLAILCARFGPDVPYDGGLDAGFSFRGRRVPYLSRQKGIFRAAVHVGRRRSRSKRPQKRRTVMWRHQTAFCTTTEPARSIKLTTARFALRTIFKCRSSISLVRGPVGIGLTFRSSSLLTTRQRDKCWLRLERWSALLMNRRPSYRTIQSSGGTPFERCECGSIRHDSAVGSCPHMVANVRFAD